MLELLIVVTYVAVAALLSGLAARAWFWIRGRIPW